MNYELIEGTFVKEEKNRFICSVIVDDKIEECYIPSSCRLDNFLELSGKEILLVKNKNANSRTRLSVYAIKYRQNYILLRSSEANEIIMDSMHRRMFSFLGERSAIEREFFVEGYKADIFIPKTQTIIEIKSIISTRNDAFFPTVYSERAVEQLKKIGMLLKKGYKIVYIFVSLNPYVRSISISDDVKENEYKNLFLKCVKEGMLVKAYSSKLESGNPTVKKEIVVYTG